METKRAQEIMESVAADDITSLDHALITLIADLQKRLEYLETVAVTDWRKGR